MKVALAVEVLSHSVSNIALLTMRSLGDKRFEFPEVTKWGSQPLNWKTYKIRLNFQSTIIRCRQSKRG